MWAVRKSVSTHAVNDQIFTTAGFFYLNQGASSQDGNALPHINVTGDRSCCGGGSWQQAGTAFRGRFLRTGTLQTFTSNGALIIQNGSLKLPAPVLGR
jgi:hypothetical protein